MSNLTFGSYDVETRKIGEETFVSCKGVIGTLSQLENWLDNHKSEPFKKFHFGMGSKLSEIVIDGDYVKIACLQEDYSSFRKKVSLLKNNKNG